MMIKKRKILLLIFAFLIIAGIAGCKLYPKKCGIVILNNSVVKTGEFQNNNKIYGMKNMATGLYSFDGHEGFQCIRAKSQDYLSDAFYIIDDNKDNMKAQLFPYHNIDDMQLFVAMSSKSDDSLKSILSKYSYFYAYENFKGEIFIKNKAYALKSAFGEKGTDTFPICNNLSLKLTSIEPVDSIQVKELDDNDKVVRTRTFHLKEDCVIDLTASTSKYTIIDENGKEQTYSTDDDAGVICRPVYTKSNINKWVSIEFE